MTKRVQIDNMNLSATSKFSAWAPVGVGALVSSGSVTVALGKALTSHDVADVAELGHEVVVDGSLSELMDSIAPSGCVSAEAILAMGEKSISSDVVAKAHNLSICRAALFGSIVSFAAGRNGRIREEIVDLLVDMINSDVVPVFTSDAAAGKELALCLVGSTKARVYTSSGATDAATGLAAAGLKAIQLAKTEVATMLKGKFLSVGGGCLLAAGAANLLNIAGAGSALCCEVIGGNLGTAFDAEQFETGRQHRGQVNAAQGMKAMLSGSQRVKFTTAEQKGKQAAVVVSDEVLSVLQTIPEVHGPAHDIVLGSIKSLELELNSIEAASAGSSFVGTEASQSALEVQALSSATFVLSQACVARMELLADALGIDCATSIAPMSASAYDFAAVYSQISGLSALLKREIVLAMQNLANLENVSLAAGGGKADKPKKEGAESKKPEIDESGLTPEQKLKAAAARKKKEEKAAAKKAKKGDDKAVGLVLGGGCKLVRDFLLKRANDDKLSVEDAVTALVQPFSAHPASLGAQVVLIVEEINKEESSKRKPKTAKGTRDYGPEQMRIREQVFNTIRRVFKRHGGVEIDTPVFELKEVLTGKYGEDTKLIYDLADQGGEFLALRYDLTVPFARFLAMTSVGNIKRYHIAKVYRRDQPVMAKGRYREFYQCDFDIAGAYSPMVPDAEAITVACEILRDLPVGSFRVKLNHRVLLDAIFEIAGVPANKFRPICSAVDKLDKEPWEEVRREMVEDKGLSLAVAEKVGKFVLRMGEPMELWNAFTEEKIFGKHEKANKAMEEMKILFGYLEAMGSLPYISFDMSLARGLDYYTGVIYEYVLVDGNTSVGSIAAGGRYDNLVGMFSTSNQQTPCVGVSIGVERVFTIIEKKANEKKMMQMSAVSVFVASIGGNTLTHRMKVAQMLWKANISAEFSPKENPKLKPQMDECLEKEVPYMVIFGEDEIKSNTVKLKNLREHTEIDVSLDGDELVNTLIAQGCDPISAGDIGFISELNSPGEGAKAPVAAKATAVAAAAVGSATPNKSESTEKSTEATNEASSSQPEKRKSFFDFFR